MKIEIIYQDNDLLVVNKPAGISVFDDNQEETLINLLIRSLPELKSVGIQPRYGVIHRLDKETSGLLLIAKNDASLAHFQNEFFQSRVIKEYTTLCHGTLSKEEGKIETIMTRSPKDRRKQKSSPLYDTRVKGKPRLAVSEYQVLKKIGNYTLMKVVPLTGRKHQIRSHMVYLNHPIAGDKLYSFKNQPVPRGLTRQFLHADKLIVRMMDNQMKSFESALPEELERVLDNIKKDEK